jgi:YD repeat-containing protein
MKRVFIFLFWISFVSSAQIRVDAKGDKLNGNIKKMVEYQYGFFGHRSRKVTLEQMAIYTYNEETKQEIVYGYWGNDNVRYIFKDIFKFDKDKLREYDHIQKTNTHGYYFENDSTCFLVAYQYNDNGSLSEEFSTLQDKHSSQRYTKADYLYDRRGNVIEKDVDYHSNSLDDTIKNIFKYDSGGHVVLKNTNDDKRALYTTYEYDNNYRYSEEHEFETNHDREWKTTIRRYDNRMNLIEERSYYICDDTKEQDSHIKYKYDDKGNWVERTDYQNGKKYNYIKRVITY